MAILASFQCWCQHMLTDREKLAWAAGFVDGEGSVVITDNSVTLTVGQVHRDPLLILQSMFRGQVRLQQRSKLGVRDLWVWKVSTRDAANALRQLFPFMVVKKNQALLALEFQGRMLKKGQRLSDEERHARSLLKTRMSRLNHLPNDLGIEVGRYTGVATYWEMDAEVDSLDSPSSSVVEFVA